MAVPNRQAILLLQKQLRDLMKHPVDGLSDVLIVDGDLLKWQITLIGPPDTPYYGGCFNAEMRLPENYPKNPPSITFLSQMWHPNVYLGGRVELPILLVPGEEIPMYTVKRIILSIISMLSSPNDDSPSNLEAAKQYREQKEKFNRKVRCCVYKSPIPAFPGDVDLLLEIATRTQCWFQLAAMKRVCLFWHKTLRNLSLVGSSPPLLLVPLGLPPAACCLICGADRPLSENLAQDSDPHNLTLPEEILHGRFFGSHPGGWLFVATHRTAGHVLINLRSGQRIPLPDMLWREIRDLTPRSSSIVIQAATLSSAPVALHTWAAALVLARFVGPLRPRRQVMLWRLGAPEKWFFLGEPEEEICGFEDVIYHQGIFRVLTRTEDFSLINPEEVGDPYDLVHMERLGVVKHHTYHRQFVLARYLVQSRGQLIMVARLGSKTQAPYITTGFRIFIHVLEPDRERWEETPALDGRLLFLGRGCSQSYEVLNYPGMQEGVYFISDVQFWSPENNRDYERTQRYLLSEDCGFWCEPTSLSIKNFTLPAQLPGARRHAPPVWVLPEKEEGGFLEEL